MGTVLFESQTPMLLFSNMLMMFVIYYCLQPAFYYRESLPPVRFYLGVGVIFTFCIFSFWILDWFGYQKEYIVIRQLEWYREVTSLEPVYVWLILHCPDYLVFRLIIFGGAWLFVVLIFRHLELDQDLAWFFFGVLFLPLFAYARVSLAVVMMLYGAVIISKPFGGNRLYSYMIGGAFLVCSVFFHKSAALGILVVLFSFISKTTNKNAWFYIVIAFIIAAVVARVVIAMFLGGSLGADEAMSSNAMTAGQRYMSRTDADSGIGALLGYTLERTPYYLCALLSFQIQSEYETPTWISMMLKVDMYIVLLASIFAVDLGANTSILFGRLLRFSLVPSAIVLAYAYQFDLFTKLVKITFFVGLACVIYRLTYTLYNVILMS